jgi:hypothetical protein
MFSYVIWPSIHKKKRQKVSNTCVNNVILFFFFFSWDRSNKSKSWHWLSRYLI